MRQEGFSLIEVLVALAFLAIMLPVCLQLQAISRAYVVAGRRESQAVRLAENLMESSMAVFSPDGIESGEIEGYCWQVERRRDELWVEVSWQQGDRERRLKVVTLLAPP